MRNIEFRGKCVKTGKWVYGTVVPLTGTRVAITNEYPLVNGRFISPKQTTIRGIMNLVEVQPETVGQYTGLYDNHFKKIFEGDIDKFKAIKGHYAYGQIVWDKKNTGFFSIGKGKKNKHYSPIFYMVNTVEIEIIDNIHDNPELLS